jgi:hypothetical protein
MIGYKQITKREFYSRGGFSNSRCVRVQRGAGWAYFYRID